MNIIIEKLTLSNNKILWHIRYMLIQLFYFRKNIISLIKSFRKNILKSRYKYVIGIISCILKCIIILLICHFVDPVLIKKGIIKTVDDNAYKNILIPSVIASISLNGVLLGIYCSNINNIYSLKYKNANQSIVEYFVNDKKILNCINSIEISLFYSIALIIVMWFNSSNFSCYCMFFAILIKSLIIFCIDGNNITYISNPLLLNNNICEEIIDDFKELYDNATYYKYVSIHKNIREKVKKKIDLLNDLSNYYTGYSEEQFTSLIDYMYTNTMLVFQYWKIKCQIDCKSDWFEKLSKFKKWHFSDSIEIERLIKYGQSVSNNIVINRNWLENRLFSINNKCIKLLVKNNSIELLLMYTLLINNINIEIVGVEETNLWISYIENLYNQICNLTIEDYRDTNEYASSIFQSIVVMYLNCIFKFKQFIMTYDFEFLYEDYLNCIKNSKYVFKNILLNTEEIRNLSVKLHAEYEIESRFITPEWLIKQYIAINDYKSIETIIGIISSLFSKSLKICNYLIENNMYLSMLIVYSRILETYNKCSDILNVIEQMCITLNNYMIDNSFQYNRINYTIIGNELVNIKDMLFKAYSINTMLVEKEQNSFDDYPDLIGLFYNNMCNCLVEAICKFNYNDFQKYYTDFINKVFSYQKYIIKDIDFEHSDFQNNYYYNVMMSPYKDYAIISSYAILIGELLEDKRWKETVSTEFNKYTETKDDLNKLKILSMGLLNSSNWGDNRYSIRFEWNKEVCNSIIKVNKLEVQYDSFGTKHVKTENKIIKKYIESSFNNFRIIDGIENIYYDEFVKDKLDK